MQRKLRHRTRTEIPEVNKRNIILLPLTLLAGIADTFAQELAFDRNGRPENGPPAGVPLAMTRPSPILS